MDNKIIKHIKNFINERKNIQRQSDKSKYDITKDIIIPIIGIITTLVLTFATIIVYIEANKLSQEANLINKKSEPLIYSVEKGPSIGTYSFEYNDEKLEIPCNSFAIKVG